MKKEFKTKYLLDEKTYEEFGMAMLFSRTRWIIITLLYFVLFVSNVLYNNFKESTILLILFIIVMGAEILSGKLKTNYKRSLIANNGKPIDVELTLNEKEIIAKNSKGHKNTYSYDEVINVIETKNLIILRLKYNLGININKKALSGGTIKELYDFLFSKCSNLKRKKPRLFKHDIYYNIILSILFAVIYITFIIIR